MEHPRRQRGFTLVELLMVVLIVGLLASIAIPLFNAQRAKAKETAALSTLQTALRSSIAFYLENGERYTGFTNVDLNRIERSLSELPPSVLVPGSQADPSRIQITVLNSGGDVRLCNVSKGRYSFCLTSSNDNSRLAYQAGTGDVASTTASTSTSGGFDANATPSAAALVLADNPVGYWQLNETSGATADDSGPVGIDGAYEGSVSLGDAGRSGGKAVTLSSGRVAVPDSSSTRMTGSMTVETWVYRTATNPDWGRIVGKGDNVRRNYGLWAEAGSNAGNVLFQQYNSSGNALFNITATGALPLNAWTHLAAVVDGNNVRIYVNGTLSASGSKSGSGAVSGDPLTFGRADFHSSFLGRIDEVALYDYALPAARIAAHANG